MSSDERAVTLGNPAGDTGGGSRKSDLGGVSAGRGVLYISIAKIYFMFAGAAIEFALPSILGRFGFGAYGFINQWASNVNNVVVTGTIQAVSRYTAADPERADDVKAAGLRMHLMLGLPLAILLALSAPLWAYLAHDPGKTGLLSLAPAVVGCYAFYTVFVGSANGTRQFHKQAALDMTSATLRAGGIIGAALLGLGVFGVIAAWVAVSGAMLVIAAIVVGLPRGNLRAGQVAPMARFLGGLALYLIILNFLMSADQFLLKRLSAEWFHAHPEWLATHGGGADAATQADGQVGFYRAVQTFARLPYQLMLAVTFVIFPLVSRSTFEGDAEKTRGYVRTTMRYSLIAAGAMGVALAANSTGILSVPYPREYAVEGGLALLILALGNVAFALFSIGGTILNGAGRTGDTIVVAAATLVLLVVGLWIGIPRCHPGAEMLTVCAATSAAAMVLAAAGTGWQLLRRFGAFVPLLTIARVVLAGAAAIAVGQKLETHGKIMALAELVLAALIYAAVLVGTRELGRADLGMVIGALRKRRPS